MSLPRRTLLVAAWTVPVVRIAAPIPVFAASMPGLVASIDGVCKLPGASCSALSKGYVYQLVMTSPASDDLWLQSVSVTANGLDFVVANLVDPITGAAVPLPALIPAGSTITLILNTDTGGQSGNVADISGTVSLVWGYEPTGIGGTLVVPFSAPDTPPANGADCPFALPDGC